MPRHFNQSELDDLVLSGKSKLDFYMNIGDINSVSELVSGMVSSLNQKVQQSDGNLNNQEIELQSQVSCAARNFSKIKISTKKRLLCYVKKRLFYPQPRGAKL